MANQELIKNYETVREYLRQFFVYGFQSRSDFRSKSGRTYDEMRRKIDNWLRSYMCFSQTAEGKRVFIEVDSRATPHNPFYTTLKTKSFTEREVFLHFFLLDVFYSEQTNKTVRELYACLLDYLPDGWSVDETSLRLRVNEYVEMGLLKTQRVGRKLLFSRTQWTDLRPYHDILCFFSEAIPCGVIGSFLLDRIPQKGSHFQFKHRYFTAALDSEVLYSLFSAIRLQKSVWLQCRSRQAPEGERLLLVPLRIYQSVQTGRQHLIAYQSKTQSIDSYRLDNLSNVQEYAVCEEFSSLLAQLLQLAPYMWGVSCRGRSALEHIEFDLRIGGDEPYVLRRLNREKRCGSIRKLDDTHYRFAADVIDALELLPWIRTFLSRITALHCSNQSVEERFKTDLRKLYEMYCPQEDSP